MNELTEQMVKTRKEAARKMTGAKRRSFEAQVALDYLSLRRCAAGGNRFRLVTSYGRKGTS